LKDLLTASLKSSTAKTYQRNWEAFHSFANNILQQQSPFPADPVTVSLFISHLNKQKLSYTTVKTYTFAISFIHRIQQQPDPTTALIVTKAFTGLKNKAAKSARPQLLPITRSLLDRLLVALPHCLHTLFDQKLWAAIFTLSYHACLRAGEAVQSENKEHTLQFAQVFLNPSSANIKFNSFKHSGRRTPTVILQKDDSSTSCPVRTLRDYLNIRGNHAGPLFTNSSKLPIDRANFSKILKDVAQVIGLDPTYYNTHSFRVGRATQLAEDQHSPSTIQSAGRWNSSAYLQYIRPNHITLPQ
jgi:integrase